MSSLELQHFESVPAGNGMVLFRLAGRWPRQADADAPETLMIDSGGETHELDALPEPGLSGDGGARNAAFAGPAALKSTATGFALAVGDLVFDLPSCDSRMGAPDRASGPGARLAAAAAALPRPRMPIALKAPLTRPLLDAGDMDELRVTAAGCALGAVLATAILVEIVP